MINENRDILVERLEQKLVSREKEINELRKSLKDSILSELRENMNDEVIVEKRLSTLEKKVKDMSLAYDGVMKELLDQKTVIQDLKVKYLKNEMPLKTERQSPLPEVKAQKKSDDKPEAASKPESQYIIAESEEPRLKSKRKDKDESTIIIANHSRSKSSNNGDIIVESRDDEDVVLEYKK